MTESDFIALAKKPYSELQALKLKKQLSRNATIVNAPHFFSYEACFIIC